MKRNKKIVDPAKRDQALFAANAGAQRASEAGLDLKPIGAINAAKRVESSTPVMVFNSGNAVAYVAFGAQNVTVIGPLDGIPILPNEKYMVNSGKYEWIIASSNTVYAYVADFQEIE